MHLVLWTPIMTCGSHIPTSPTHKLGPTSSVVSITVPVEHSNIQQAPLQYSHSAWFAQKPSQFKKFNSMAVASTCQCTTLPWYRRRGGMNGRRSGTMVCRAAVQQETYRGGPAGSYAREMERLSAKESLLLAVRFSVYFYFCYLIFVVIIWNRWRDIIFNFALISCNWVGFNPNNRIKVFSSWGWIT